MTPILKILVYKAINGALPCCISDLLNYRTSKQTLWSVLFSTPSSDHESETEDLRRENVCCGGTRTMELDPTRTKI